LVFLVSVSWIRKDFGLLGQDETIVSPVDCAVYAYDTGICKDVVKVAVALTEAVVIARSAGTKKITAISGSVAGGFAILVAEGSKMSFIS
jgi:hypothetical protein